MLALRRGHNQTVHLQYPTGWVGRLLILYPDFGCVYPFKCA